MSIPSIIVIPKYQEGTHEGGIQTSEYYSIMEKVAKENYKKWGYNNEDEALIHLLNATDYDYRGYYNKYPESRANADTHWTDEFKTVYHPTFSKDSIYSGKKSQFNPRGTIGGRWDGLEYRPSYSQVFNNDFDFNKTNLYLRNSGNREYIDRYYQDIYDRAKELEKINGAVTLDTYYPIISSYPWTGHSSLQVSGLIPNYQGDAQIGSLYIDKGGNDKDYNLVTNNCSDATRCALEKIFDKKINPILFTTPGDVQDFALDELGGIKYRIDNMLYSNQDGAYKSYDKEFLDKIEKKGRSTVYIPVTKEQKNKLIEYIQKGKQNREFANGGKLNYLNLF